MKKISHYFKTIASILLKVIVATMMGLGASFGNKPIELEQKDNKTIEENK